MRKRRKAKFSNKLKTNLIFSMKLTPMVLLSDTDKLKYALEKSKHNETVLKMRLSRRTEVFAVLSTIWHSMIRINLSQNLWISGFVTTVPNLSDLNFLFKPFPFVPALKKVHFCLLETTKHCAQVTSSANGYVRTSTVSTDSNPYP